MLIARLVHAKQPIGIGVPRSHHQSGIGIIEPHHAHQSADAHQHQHGETLGDKHPPSKPEYCPFHITDMIPKLHDR